MLTQMTILVLSIFALYWGAEFTLDAGEKIGKKLGLSPLVIGLVLIGFGTSLPEFFVSQLACYRGEVDIALGNIIGSNITNLFLVLGVSGVIAPLTLLADDIKRQVVIHLMLTCTLGLVILFVGVNLKATAIFSVFFALYLYDTLHNMKHQDDDDEEGDHGVGPVLAAKLIAGFALLFFGGDFLVQSGTELGRLTGISSFVISAILVAFGTSFPELVTAILACVKKKDKDLITGNIIGSNVFNVAFVLGSVGFYDVTTEKAFDKELGALLFASLLLIALVMIKKSFGRIAGFIYLCSYCAMVGTWLGLI